MKFDKTNVYSEFDKLGVYPGTYGLFSDTVSDLGYIIENDKINSNILQKGKLYEVIQNEGDIHCFGYKSDPKDPDVEYYKYFYPLEEPVSVYRPFKDAREAFEYLSRTDFVMPKGTSWYQRVLTIGEKYIYVSSGNGVNSFNYKGLLDEFTMTDGTPCGVKMED